jgi:hypothetical protein
MKAFSIFSMLSFLYLLIYNVTNQYKFNDSRQDKPFNKHAICFPLLLGVTAAIQSSTIISVSAQNTTNLSLTESEPLGILTITAQQLKELESSMNDIRQALEQRNITQALVNLTILEGQVSIIAEET